MHLFKYHPINVATYIDRVLAKIKSFSNTVQNNISIYGYRRMNTFAIIIHTKQDSQSNYTHYKIEFCNLNKSPLLTHQTNLLYPHLRMIYNIDGQSGKYNF